jgi:hypothetical protein
MIRLACVLSKRFADGIVRTVAFSAASALMTGSAWAQCQMCKKTAAYQQSSAIEALNQGIILLAIPPIAIIGGIAWLAYRHRDGYRIED